MHSRTYYDMFLDFDNEISDEPKKWEGDFRAPKQIVEALDKDNKQKEADFRKWLIKYKPKTAVMTPIETNTTTGVPDIYTCYTGFSSWIECKTRISGAPSIRGTQYLYLKKLIEAGGKAKIAIQKLSTKDYKPSLIHIYNAVDIVTIPSNMFKKQGQNMVFPTGTKPWYTWHYNKPKEYPIEYLYQRLLLDVVDFT